MKTTLAQQTFRDDFESANSLENWSNLEVKGWASKIRNIQVYDGMLLIEPTSSGWFEDNYACHLFRPYTGDFTLTTKIKVEGINSNLPETSFSLAGLFIRKPRNIEAESWERYQENWIFFSIGSATEPGKPQFEIKSTYNSQSTLKIFPARDKWVELQIVRVSEIFTLLYRFEGGEWLILDQFIRPDLPETLNIGITAYADWPSVSEIYPDYEQYNRFGTKEDKGDLRAFVDYIEIGPAPVEKELPIANFIGEQILAEISK